MICETGNPHFGEENGVVVALAGARLRARQERMEANRMATCGVYAGDPDFDAVQLQRTESRMS